MRCDENAIRLLVFLADEDRSGHRGLHQFMSQGASGGGVARGILWRAIDGFGRAGTVRSNRFPDSIPGIPLALALIDPEERIASFLPVLAELAPASPVPREPVQMSRATPTS